MTAVASGVGPPAQVTARDAYLAAAGFFITQLAELRGWQSIAELYRAVPPNADAATFERQFESVYSRTMDEVWTEALAKEGARSCQPDWACHTTVLAPGARATPDCDREYHRRIELPEAGAILASLTGRESEVMLMDCDSSASHFDLLGSFTTDSAVHLAHLPRGAYTLFRGQGRLPDEVELRATLPGGWVAESCESAGTLSLHPSAESSIDFPGGSVVQATNAPESDTAWLGISGGGHSYEVTTFDLGVTAEGSVALCDNCDSTASCTELSQGHVSSMTIGDAVLRFRRVFAWPAPSSGLASVLVRPTPEVAPKQ